MKYLCLTIASGIFFAFPAKAQDDAQDLAKQLSNPIASLISAPMQLNYDDGFGPDDEGHRWTLNVQPVIPISLNDKWNVISRTIVPVISQDNVVPGTDQFGIGDTVQSAFFSPKEVGDSGIIWGVGPVFLLPTGTSDALGGDKWGIGPTAVALKQNGPMTIGVLANQIWSFAGDEDRPDVSQAFIQPFVSYTTPSAITYSLNTEMTINWKTDDVTLPINAVVTKLTKFGDQPVQLGIGGKVYLERPENGPDWGLRFIMVFLFPAG